MSRPGPSSAAVAAVLVFGGCAQRPMQPPPTAVLEVVPADDWPALTDDLDPESLEAACRSSIEVLDLLSPDEVFSFGPVVRSASELARGTRRACAIVARSVAVEERRRALLDEFLLLRSTGRDGSGEVLFTGYYEQLLEARHDASGSFTFPIYGVPGNLVTVDLGDFGIVADPPRIAGRRRRHRLCRQPGGRVFSPRPGLGYPGLPRWRQGPGRICRDQRTAVPIHRPVAHRRRVGQPGGDVHAGDSRLSGPTPG
jgi:membrane-bound lytic murein transglycosylase A